MKANQSELIKDISKKQLTAKGHKIVWMFVRKAAEANNTCSHDNRPAFKEKKEKMITVVNALIFERNATYADLTDLLRKIEINKAEPIQVATNEAFFV